MCIALILWVSLYFGFVMVLCIGLFVLWAVWLVWKVWGFGLACFEFGLFAFLDRLCLFCLCCVVGLCFCVVCYLWAVHVGVRVYL